MSARTRLADPFSGVYNPEVCAWWSDSGRDSAIGERITHFKTLYWAMGSGAAGNEIERLRACYSRVANGERGPMWEMCVCDKVADVEVARSKAQGYGDPKQGLVSLIVDLQNARDELGLRWPITKRIYEAQGAEEDFFYKKTLLEAGIRFRPQDREPYPGGWYAFRLMAAYLGWRWTSRWPREKIGESE